MQGSLDKFKYSNQSLQPGYTGSKIRELLGQISHVVPSLTRRTFLKSGAIATATISTGVSTKSNAEDSQKTKDKYRLLLIKADDGRSVAVTLVDDKNTEVGKSQFSISLDRFGPKSRFRLLHRRSKEVTDRILRVENCSFAGRRNVTVEFRFFRNADNEWIYEITSDLFGKTIKSGANATKVRLATYSAPTNILGKLTNLLDEEADKAGAYLKAEIAHQYFNAKDIQKNLNVLAPDQFNVKADDTNYRSDIEVKIRRDFTWVIQTTSERNSSKPKRPILCHDGLVQINENQGLELAWINQSSESSGEGDNRESTRSDKKAVEEVKPTEVEQSDIGKRVNDLFVVTGVAQQTEELGVWQFNDDQLIKLKISDQTVPFTMIYFDQASVEKINQPTAISIIEANKIVVEALNGEHGETEFGKGSHLKGGFSAIELKHATFTEMVRVTGKPTRTPDVTRVLSADISGNRSGDSDDPIPTVQRIKTVLGPVDVRPPIVETLPSDKSTSSFTIGDLLASASGNRGFDNQTAFWLVNHRRQGSKPKISQLNIELTVLSAALALCDVTHSELSFEPSNLTLTINDQGRSSSAPDTSIITIFPDLNKFEDWAEKGDEQSSRQTIQKSKFFLGRFDLTRATLFAKEHRSLAWVEFNFVNLHLLCDPKPNVIAADDKCRFIETGSGERVDNRPILVLKLPPQYIMEEAAPALSLPDETLSNSTAKIKRLRDAIATADKIIQALQKKTKAKVSSAAEALKFELAAGGTDALYTAFREFYAATRGLSATQNLPSDYFSKSNRSHLSKIQSDGLDNWLSSNIEKFWDIGSSAEQNIGKAHISGQTRLAFRINCVETSADTGVLTAFDFSFKDLLKLSRHEPAVTRRAERYIPHVNGLIRPANLATYDLKPQNMLEYQGIRSHRTSGLLRMDDVRQSLAIEPSEIETAIEIPARLILSTSQRAVWLATEEPDVGIFEAPDQGKDKPVKLKNQTSKSVNGHNNSDQEVCSDTSSKQIDKLWSLQLLTDDATPDVRVVSTPDYRAETMRGWPAGSRRAEFLPPSYGSKPPWMDSSDLKYNFLNELSAGDRHQLMLLTSAYGLPTIGFDEAADNDPIGDGDRFSPDERYVLDDVGEGSGIYSPAILDIDEMSLTALGGTLRHDTAFSPPLPARYEDKGAPVTHLENRPLYDGLSIERYQHHIVLGRMTLARIAYKGYLMPFGHRVSLVKLTERLFIKDPQNGIVAKPIQRIFITIASPTKRFPAVLQPSNGRRFGPETVIMQSVATPDLLDPWNGVENDNQEINSHGKVMPADYKDLVGLAFWPHGADRKLIKFQFLLDGTWSQMPMLFVDNVVIGDPDGLRSVARHFNSVRDDLLNHGTLTDNDDRVLPKRTCDMGGGPVRYAPELKSGDTQLATTRITFAVEGMRSSEPSNAVSANLNPSNTDFGANPTTEAAQQPPFYPTIETSELRLDEITRFTGQSLRPALVRHDGHFVRYGFKQEIAAEGVAGEENEETIRSRENKLDVYLNFLGIEEIAKLQKLGMGNDGDRSGGIGRPSGVLTGYSRNNGPISNKTSPNNLDLTDLSATHRTHMTSLVDSLKDGVETKDKQPTQKAASGGLVSFANLTASSGTPVQIAQGETTTLTDVQKTNSGVENILKNFFDNDAKVLGIMTFSEIVELLQITALEEILPILEEALGHGIALANEGLQAIDEMVETVRNDVLIPASEVVQRLDDQWNEFDVLLKDQTRILQQKQDQTEISTENVALSVDALFPEISRDLNGLKLRLEEAIGESNPIELVDRLSKVYEAGRILVRTLVALTNNPVERLEAGVRDVLDKTMGAVLQALGGQTFLNYKVIKDLIDNPAIVSNLIIDELVNKTRVILEEAVENALNIDDEFFKYSQKLSRYFQATAIPDFVALLPRQNGKIKDTDKAMIQARQLMVLLGDVIPNDLDIDNLKQAFEKIRRAIKEENEVLLQEALFDHIKPFAIKILEQSLKVLSETQTLIDENKLDVDELDDILNTWYKWWDGVDAELEKYERKINNLKDELSRVTEDNVLSDPTLRSFNNQIQTLIDSVEIVEKVVQSLKENKFERALKQTSDLTDENLFWKSNSGLEKLKGAVRGLRDNLNELSKDPLTLLLEPEEPGENFSANITAVKNACGDNPADHVDDIAKIDVSSWSQPGPEVQLIKPMIEGLNAAQEAESAIFDVEKDLDDDVEIEIEGTKYNLKTVLTDSQEFLQNQQKNLAGLICSQANLLDALAALRSANLGNIRDVWGSLNPIILKELTSSHAYLTAIGQDSINFADTYKFLIISGGIAAGLVKLLKDQISPAKLKQFEADLKKHEKDLAKNIANNAAQLIKSIAKLLDFVGNGNLPIDENEIKVFVNSIPSPILVESEKRPLIDGFVRISEAIKTLNEVVNEGAVNLQGKLNRIALNLQEVDDFDKLINLPIPKLVFKDDGALKIINQNLQIGFEQFTIVAANIQLRLKSYVDGFETLLFKPFATVLRDLHKELHAGIANLLKRIRTNIPWIIGTAEVALEPKDGGSTYLDEDIKHLNQIIAAKYANENIGKYLKKWVDDERQAAPLEIAEGVTKILGEIAKGDILALIDVATIRDEIEDALRDLIPVKKELKYDFGQEFKGGSENALFAPKKGSRFDLKFRATVDLLDPGNLDYKAEGAIGPFTVNLLQEYGIDAVRLIFGGASFSMGAGEKFSFDVEFKDYKIGSALEFVKALQDYLGLSGNGLYIKPLFRTIGVQAGYALNLGVINLGGLTFGNVSLAISAELPFDDSDAWFNVSLSTVDAPFTIAALPWAGSGYFGIIATAKSIIGFEAAFGMGVFGGFQMGPLTAVGAIRAGFYIRTVKTRVGRVTEIYGTFYAGGTGSISIFSISTSLDVRLGMDQTGRMFGQATYQFSFKMGFIKVGISLTASYGRPAMANGDASSGNDRASLRRSPDHRSSSGNIELAAVSDAYGNVQIETEEQALDAISESPDGVSAKTKSMAEDWTEYQNYFDMELLYA
jgi:hypothetical protein